MSNTFTVSSVALPVRPRDAHKGDFGRVLIIAGSSCYTGAPSFAARGAVRAGAGLVFLGVPKILDKLKNSDICLIGPGLGLSEDTFNIVYSVIENASCPLVIDADGITAVARNIVILERAKSDIVLTPHEGEFLRLGGSLEGGRVEAARRFAQKHGAILVLKGRGTVTAFPDGDCFLNTTGNPGMAKGGSGDVLAGMIAGLVPQLRDLKSAVPAAVYLHGKAGDLAAEALGEYAMTPSDILGYLPFAMR